MQKHSRPGPSLLPTEHPRCPNCHQVRMNLTGIAPGPKGFDIRAFECSKCGHVRTVSVESDPMNSAVAGWVAGGLKPPD